MFVLFFLGIATPRPCYLEICITLSSFQFSVLNLLISSNGERDTRALTFAFNFEAYQGIDMKNKQDDKKKTQESSSPVTVLQSGVSLERLALLNLAISEGLRRERGADLEV